MRTTRRLVPPLLVAFLGLALFAASAAEARRGPCIAGQKKPACQIWTAKVKAVRDGDTVVATIKQGSRFSERQGVHLVGIEAMEPGQCHAVEAAERLEDLVLGRTVRLSSRRSSSRTSGKLLRSVAFKQGGRWQDAGSVLVAEGHALWDPHGTEWAWNNTYAKLAGFAARAGDGIWDTDSCGAGPAAGSVLSLKVKWDADGIDGRNVNGEFIRISNTGPTDVSLSGWWARDAFLRRYTFPASAVVPAGGSILLRVGRGSNDADTFFWRESSPVFENVVGGKKGIGDGGYLFDPQGDLRAWAVYPCRAKCSEPLKGKVKLNAQRKAPESITVTNTSSGPIDLSEYEVETSPYFYEFARGTIVPPQGSIVVNVAGKPSDDTEFVKNWGRNKFVLADRKDVVTLRNPLGAPVMCRAWGGARCPGV